MNSTIFNTGRLRRACWSGLAGVALAASLGGCGGDDERPGAAASAETDAGPITLAAKSDKSYGVVKAGAGSTVEVYRNTSGAATQTLYTNPKTGEQVRVFNDSTGLPVRLQDEKTGDAITVTRTTSDRLDYRAYDKLGNYTGGYAVLLKSDGLYAAPVQGTPSFNGQLSGQLTGATLTGSFALTPASDAGLGTAVPFSTGALAFADSFPDATQALAVHRAAVLVIDQRAIIGGFAMGLATGIASGNVPALIAGGMTAYALQRIGLPIFDGINTAATLQNLTDLLNTLLARFDNGASATVAMNDALAGTIVAKIAAAVIRAFDATLDLVSALVDPTTLLALTAIPSTVTTNVGGFGVDQSGTDYTVSGTVTPAGVLTATATSDTGATILITGTVDAGTLTGTMTGNLGAGTVTGSLTALGQCAELQQSGGQGTFSFAFDAVATQGTISFFREAYTIPDGFRVISNGVVLYDTHGLVSGNETVNLTLNGSSVVFVNVNAPNDGTAWELTVGCPI